MDDVIREGRLKEALIIKKTHYMVVMRSAFWAQGWWRAEDPVLPGLGSGGLISWKVFFFFFPWWTWLKVTVLWRELFNMAVMVEPNLYGHFKYVIYVWNFPPILCPWDQTVGSASCSKVAWRTTTQIIVINWRHASVVELLVCTLHKRLQKKAGITVWLQVFIN